MNVGHELVGVSGDNRKGANPFARRGLLPVFPDPGNRERRAILHGDRIRLPDAPLDCLPFEKAVHRYDAPPPAISLAERG